MEALYKKVYDMVKKQLFERAIAIDTEYHATGSKIDRVYCIAACRMDKSKIFSQWCEEGKGATLKEISEYLCIKNPIFICHGLEIAERRAFLSLHDIPDAYDWIDTYILARAVENTACTSRAAPSFSLMSMCSKHLHIDIDGAYKKAMQDLCIHDCTKGHEDSILQYCVEDTQYLHDLACTLITEHALALDASVKVGMYEKKNMVERALEITRSVIEFSQIADKGLPVSADRVQRLKEHASEYVDKKVSKISCKYPGLYRIERGKKVQDQNAVQKYMKECVDKFNLFDYPRTSTGRLSTSTKDLERFFANRCDCFGYDLLFLSKSTSHLKGITGKKDSWLKNYDPEHKRIYYQTLKPFGATTGRCTPQASEGFIPAWDKTLQGLLDPPPGKWLVELDFTAEETFIQAGLYHDGELMRVYQSKDIYLYYCALAGVIPVQEFNDLSKAELKEKYREIRGKFKALILGNSYGAGVPRLAEASGLNAKDAGKFKTRIDRALCASVQGKAALTKKIAAARGIAFLDGWTIRTAPREGEDAPSQLSIGNSPVQGLGAAILRAAVHALMTDPSTRRASLVATVHDAVWMEISEGDYDVITAASEIMRTTADRLCGATGMRVGEPQIIRHGELWTPDHAHDAAFCELCAKDYLDYTDDG